MGLELLTLPDVGFDLCSLLHQDSSKHCTEKIVQCGRGLGVYLMVPNNNHGTEALNPARFGAFVCAVHVNQLHGV